MPPVHPTANPSETVERIREILVGRQIDHLQARLLRLEASQQVASSDSGARSRLDAQESRLEMIQRQLFELQQQQQATQTALDHRSEYFQAESQRLAQVIQHTVNEQTMRDAQHQEQLEQGFHRWFAQWQASLQEHLETREAGILQRVQEALHNQFASMQALVQQQLASTQRDSLALERQFRQIAEAASTLADSIGAAAPRPMVEARQAQ